MCTLKGISNCSQHYTKCGSVCVEKYLMWKWSNKVINSVKVQSRNVERFNWSWSLSLLWRPMPQLFSALRGQMYARCSANYNFIMFHLTSWMDWWSGYWLCGSSTECILSSTAQRGSNMSSLCDGKLDCGDRSDEAWLVCLQVGYFYIS